MAREIYVVTTGSMTFGWDDYEIDSIYADRAMAERKIKQIEWTNIGRRHPIPARIEEWTLIEPGDHEEER